MTTTEKITAGIMAAATLLLIRNTKGTSGVGALLGWDGHVTGDMLDPYRYPAWNKGLQVLSRELGFVYTYNPQNGTYGVYYPPKSGNIYLLVCVIAGDKVYWSSRFSRSESSYYNKIKSAIQIALEMNGKQHYQYEAPTWSPEYMHLFTD